MCYNRQNMSLISFLVFRKQHVCGTMLYHMLVFRIIKDLCKREKGKRLREHMCSNQEKGLIYWLPSFTYFITIPLFRNVKTWNQNIWKKQEKYGENKYNYFCNNRIILWLHFLYIRYFYQYWIQINTFQKWTLMYLLQYIAQY